MIRSLRLAAGLAVGLLAARTASADTLVVCTEASPTSLNAMLSTANTVFDVAAQIYDELVETQRGASTIIPAIATSWEIAPDGLSATFHLRHGVKFQSNSHFTPTRDLNADDVLFSFNRMKDKSGPFYKVGGGTYDEWDALLGDRVTAITKVDDDTVRFDLKEPVAPLLGILSMPSFPIMSAEYGAAMLKADTPEAIDSSPIGTGAFSFVRYLRDSDVRFRAFPQNWAKAAGIDDRTAKVDNLVFSITPDPAVRLAKLRANECQIARYPNPADLPAPSSRTRRCRAATARRVASEGLHRLPRRQAALRQAGGAPSHGRGDRPGLAGQGICLPGHRHTHRRHDLGQPLGP